MPAKAGIQAVCLSRGFWIPAFGTVGKRVGALRRAQDERKTGKLDKAHTVRAELVEARFQRKSTVPFAGMTI